MFTALSEFFERVILQYEIACRWGLAKIAANVVLSHTTHEHVAEHSWIISEHMICSRPNTRLYGAEKKMECNKSVKFLFLFLSLSFCVCACMCNCPCMQQ